MRKQEFLDALKQRLVDLPQADVAERLNFYSEMIDDRIEEGLGEEEAVAAIGTVDEVAAQITAEITPLRAIVNKLKTKKRLSGTEITLLVVGSPLWLTLLLSVFAVVLSLYVSIWATVISLWASGAALVGSAIGGIGLAVLALTQGSLPTAQILLCLVLVAAGLSIFFFFGCKWATKGVLWLTRKSAHLIKKSFTKKEA